MKFIHTGDIHWGVYPDTNKPQGEERTQAARSTLRMVIEKAKEMDVGCLFVSGDLFHRQPLIKDLKEVNYLFSTIPVVRAILIAGNHDRIRGNSALLSFIWSPNVTLIMDEALTFAYLEDINAEVHGFNYHMAEIEAPLLEDIQVPLSSRIQILMAHGGDTAHLPTSFNSLELSPFPYIALGHIHRPHVLTDGKVAYRGSPEPLDPTETGSHGFYMGKIHPVTRKLINLQFTLATSLQYIPLAVNVPRNTIDGELCDHISNEIEDRGSQRIYRLQIRDMRDPDIKSDLEQLTVRCRITEIIDDSKPRYDSSALFVKHPSDMVGFYTQTLQKKDMSPVGKKALYHGVSALLHTTGERSRTHEGIKSAHRGIR